MPSIQPETDNAPTALSWKRFSLVFGVLVLVFIAVFASFGGLLEPRERIAAAVVRITTSGLPAALYLLGAIGLGRLGAAFWHNAAEKLPLQAGFGLGIMLWISHLLGVMGVFAGPLGPWAALAPVAIGCLMLAAQAGGASRAAPKLAAPHPLWLAAAAPIALLLVAAGNPPGTLWASEARGYDVLSYHAQLPREWLAGGLWPLDHNVYSYLPSYVEAGFLHLLGMTFAAPAASGETAPGIIAGDGWRLLSFNYLHAGITILAAWLVGRAAARITATREDGNTTGRRRIAAAVAGLLVLATPWTLVVGSLAYNEMAVVALLAAAMIAAWERDLPAWYRGLLTGLLIGAACGAKPTAIFMAAPVAGLLLLGGLAPRQWVAAIGGGCIAGLAMIGPWLIRNGIASGNPVFPHATSLFDGGHWSPEQIERYLANHHFQGGLADRLRLMFVAESSDASNGGAEIFRHRGLMHPQWVIFFPVVLVAAALSIARSVGRKPALLVSGGLVVQIAAWLFLTHIQSRFLLPCIAPGAVLIGIAAASVRPPGVGVIAAVIIAAVQLMASVRGYAAQNNGSPNAMLAFGAGFITGLPLREEYAALPPAEQRERIDQLSVQAFLNLVAPPHLELLLVGGSPELYLVRDAEYARVWDTSPLATIIRESPDQPAQWTPALRAAGYDLILIDLADLTRLEESGFLDPALSVANIEAWMTRHALLIKSWPEAGIYLLAPVDPAARNEEDRNPQDQSSQNGNGEERPPRAEPNR